VDLLAPPILAAAITSLVLVGVYFLGRFRDNKLRFIADKRAAYTEYVAATHALEILSRDLDELQALLTEEPSDERSAKMTRWLFDRGVTDADLAPQLTRVAQATQASEIIEAASATQGRSPMDLALLSAAGQLMLDRNKAAADRVLAAAAVIGLVAPEPVLKRIERLEKLASSDPAYAAPAQEVVAAMRKDLGVDPWRRRWRWWRSPDRWWRAATP
jgi:hypothetical protein